MGGREERNLGTLTAGTAAVMGTVVVGSRGNHNREEASCRPLAAYKEERTAVVSSRKPRVATGKVTAR